MRTDKPIVGITLLITTILTFNCFGETLHLAAESSDEKTIDIVMTEGAAGRTITKTQTIGAEILTIDHTARTATLLMPSGREISIVVGPETTHFNQIRKGDHVKALVTEQSSIYLVDENTKVDTGAGHAAEEKSADRIVAGTVRTFATVLAVNLEEYSVSLKFDGGRTESMYVRPDVELSTEQVGTKVVFETTRIIALSVEKSEG